MKQITSYFNQHNYFGVGLILLFVSFIANIAIAQQSSDLNTILMNSTYKIEGIDINKNRETGTGFILGRKTYSESNYAIFVLVTAKHVLEDMEGEYAYLDLRNRVDSTKFRKYSWPIKIRNGNEKMWATHTDSSIDIAALYIALPDSFKLYFKDYFLPTELLVTDSLLIAIGLHPGDELRCIGFPYGLESNSFGFPILRSGRISSYPVLPSKIVKKVMLDMTVFPGNSGSPVYFTSDGPRVINGNITNEGYQFIIGILTDRLEYSTYAEFQTLSIEQKQSLNIGVIIPSIYILETIDQLPLPYK